MNKKPYRIKYIFVGNRVYEVVNGFSIRVDVTVKEINKI